MPGSESKIYKSHFRWGKVEVLHVLLNSQPQLMHFSCSDWFTQSRLSAHIPSFDLVILWQMIELSVPKL